MPSRDLSVGVGASGHKALFQVIAKDLQWFGVSGGGRAVSGRKELYGCGD